MSKPAFDIKNRIKKDNPAEKFISQELIDKAENKENKITQETENIQEEVKEQDFPKKTVKTDRKEHKAVPDIQIRKDGKVDRRFKSDEEKLTRKFPLSLKAGMYENLELIAFYRKISVNQLINDLLELGIDKKELGKYLEIEKSLNQ